MAERPSSHRVVFRVSAGDKLGMGHVARCLHLARALRHHSLECLFLLDQYPVSLHAFLEAFPAKTLYPTARFNSEEDDAEYCLPLLNAGDWLVLDDYRLSIKWESKLRSHVEKIIVIDDLANRVHDCDVLIDYRVGDKSALTKRYANLLPAHCHTLLGPDYVLLGEEYVKKAAFPAPDDKFNILISLGGGGNLESVTSLVDYLSQQKTLSGMHIRVVVGAMAKNSRTLRAIARQYDNLQIIEKATSLADEYRHAHLYFGAAGTALYELNCLGIPGITFSISENQKNALAELEKLGHYLHLSYDDIQNFDAIERLLLTVKNNYQRIKSLQQSCAVKIDGKGATRVVAALTKIAFNSATNTRQAYQAHAPAYHYRLSDSLIVESVTDSHINRYILARNLPANSDRMTISGAIPRIDHYNWWFNNKRESFVVKQHGRPLLYIWHQQKKHNQRLYLIGGWFVADDNCLFDTASHALSWQLAYCDRHFPEATWIAVIHKHNKFVNLLNKTQGFIPVQADSEEQREINECFPLANLASFNPVMRLPKSNATGAERCL